MRTGNAMSENPPQISNTPRFLRDKFIAAAVLILLAAAVLLPIWVAHYPTLLDFPNHLASSFVLARLHNPSYTFSQYYSGDWGLRPYIATDFAMMELGRILPPLVAGKIVLSIGALGLPLAAWFFLKQIHPGETALAFWYLLVAHNVFFRYGFVGYFCSMGLMFLTLGLWLRWLKNPSPPRWLAACAALTATYFTHIFGFAFALLIIGLYSVTRPQWREWLGSAALAIPGIVFYFISSRAVEQQSGPEFRTLGDKLYAFTLLLHTNSFLLDMLSIAAVATIFLFGWVRNRDFHWDWRWIVVAAGLLAAFMALPEGYGEGWNVDFRALPVFFVVLMATVRLGKRGWWFVPLALLVFGARTYNVTQAFRAPQLELQGLARSFAMTAPNARVLPIVESNDDDPMDQYYAHFWAYGVIERGWFSPYLFTLPGLLPLNITKDTFTLDGFWELSYDEQVNWKDLQDDYDYVWAYDAPQKFEPGLKSIGDVIYTSGKLELYKIDKSKTAAPPLHMEHP
ncbi:MAG TPA: hypothetical protein VGZ48_01270 [Candidatus Acidoferrales bacterium]|jgi:hypothetical protein|nr:hypothetical protein [Candidatus Acidoferrales bacterium]